MAIETTVITDKLKNEGISEALGAGLVFETEDALNSWVAAYKASLPQIKDITAYTKEEIEAMSKDPQFKGAKGLQGFIDSVRQKKEPNPPIPPAAPELKTLIEEALKPLTEELSTLKGKRQLEDFEASVKKVATAANITDPDLIEEIKEGLKTDASETDIKARVEKKKALWAKMGIKQFGTPGGGNGASGSVGDIAKKWKEDQLKKSKK